MWASLGRFAVSLAFYFAVLVWAVIGSLLATFAVYPVARRLVDALLLFLGN